MTKKKEGPKESSFNLGKQERTYSKYNDLPAQCLEDKKLVTELLGPVFDGDFVALYIII